MNQIFKGDVTNNVVELNLQAEAVNIATPTVVYDGASNGVINQINGRRATRLGKIRLIAIWSSDRNFMHSYW